MTATIRTVLGDILPDALGICLPHEHIWCNQTLAPRRELFGLTRSTSSWMRLDDEHRMLAELIAYRQAGGRAIVEVTCDGWGRDLDVLAQRQAVRHDDFAAGGFAQPVRRGAAQHGMRGADVHVAGAVPGQYCREDHRQPARRNE